MSWEVYFKQAGYQKIQESIKKKKNTNTGSKFAQKIRLLCNLAVYVFEEMIEKHVFPEKASIILKMYMGGLDTQIGKISEKQLICGVVFQMCQKNDNRFYFWAIETFKPHDPA